MKLRQNRYLVLGGSGFIGANLIRYLHSQGHYSKNLDLKNGPNYDLRKILIKDLKSYTGCFFLAWDVGGSKYLNNIEYWEKQYQNNFALINNIFPQLGESEIPFLFISSQLAGTDNTPYSITKLAAENYCKIMQNATVARQWNAYGSIEAYDLKSHVVSDLVRQALQEKVIKLKTTGEEKRQFVHMEDICDAYMKMLIAGNGEIYDVSSKNYISILELANKIGKLTNSKVIPGNEIGIDPKVKEIPWFPEWIPKIELEYGLQLIIQSQKK